MFQECLISGKGHGLVATVDIAPGQQIFQEEAIIVGPGSRDACVECLAVVDDGVDQLCPGCCHTLCSKCLVKSEDLKIWHTCTECDLLKSLDQDPATVYNFIFPLRLALLRKSNPEAYKTIMLLEHHLEERLEQVEYFILPSSQTHLIKGSLTISVTRLGYF